LLKESLINEVDKNEIMFEKNFGGILKGSSGVVNLECPILLKTKRIEYKQKI
jgi:hypothetical protein